MTLSDFALKKCTFELRKLMNQILTFFLHESMSEIVEKTSIDFKE